MSWIQWEATEGKWEMKIIIFGQTLKLDDFLHENIFLMENAVSKPCRLWSDATLCGIWSGSALFANDQVSW